MRVPGGNVDNIMVPPTPPVQPQPEELNNMNMGMGSDSIPNDMNNENPSDGNDDSSDENVNGVDNKAQKAAGELSYILPDASEETVDYVMGMIAPAVGKNSNVGDKDVDKWSEKMTNNDKKSDEDDDSDGELDSKNDKDDEDNLPMESKKMIKNIITEILNQYIN